MRLSSLPCRAFLVGAIVRVVLCVGAPLGAATFTVDDTGDAGDVIPGDGVCATLAGT